MMFSKKTKILVIDDDKGIRDLLLYELQKEGYTVLSAQKWIFLHSARHQNLLQKCPSSLSISLA